MTMTNAADTALTASQTRSGGISIEAKLFAGVAVFLALVITATVIWGAAGLAMSALACVPVCYAAILLITVGK
ncbi:hypothetical protein KUV62_10430 [Salipiger bermudensis]|uniref:hypothetical protein n=1 Tax=Salipiger bermudensis TaxID=344736 RepID=UPI001C99FDB4|nr:hypothetical protein [Salipiger bermudensis]MBY6004327.1 hypothetical protein [Salipiger bermudensis]